MPEDWLSRLEIRLEENRRAGVEPRNEAELLRMANAGKSEISKIREGFRDRGYADSTALPELNAVLGFEPPERGLDEQRAEVVNLMRDFSPQRKAEVVSFLRSLHEQERSRREIENVVAEKRRRRVDVKETATTDKKHDEEGMDGDRRDAREEARRDKRKLAPARRLHGERSKRPRS